LRTPRGAVGAPPPLRPYPHPRPPLPRCEKIFPSKLHPWARRGGRGRPILESSPVEKKALPRRPPKGLFLAWFWGGPGPAG